MKKLNQVIAIEKEAKAKANKKITDLHRASQHPDLFDGFSKTYEPGVEGGERLPSETKRVQVKAPEQLKEARTALVDLFEVVATKDYANCTAKADVQINGAVLVEQAPATYLLFLEKTLANLRTFVATIPTLDPASDWTFDEQAQLYKAEPTETARTKKIAKGLVLHPPTKEHPAQTQLIHEDVQIGSYLHVRQSGAMPIKERDDMIERIDNLSRAVKQAREKANLTDAETVAPGGKLMDFILGAKE